MWPPFRRPTGTTPPPCTRGLSRILSAWSASCCRCARWSADLAPAAVRDLPWSPLILATRNFAFATEQPADSALNEYLRPVGDLLLLPTTDGGVASKTDSKPAAGGAVVLLSEREACGLMEALWPGGGGGGSNGVGKASSSRAGPLLTSLPYACAAQPTGAAAGAAQPAEPLRLAACASRQAAASLAAQLSAGRFRAQLASLQLFDGETTFVPPRQLGGRGVDAWWALPPLAALRALVTGQRAAAEALVAMRGKQVLFAFSQLEVACDAGQRDGDAA